LGVDYLGLVLASHDAETLGQLAFRDLPSAHTRRDQRDDQHQRVEEHQP